MNVDVMIRSVSLVMLLAPAIRITGILTPSTYELLYLDDPINKPPFNLTCLIRKHDWFYYNQGEIRVCKRCGARAMQMVPGLDNTFKKIEPIPKAKLVEYLGSMRTIDTSEKRIQEEA